MQSLNNYLLIAIVGVITFFLGFLISILFRKKNSKTFEDSFSISPVPDEKEEHRAPSFSLLLNQLLAIYRNLLICEGVVYLRLKDSNFEPVASSAGTEFNNILIPDTEGLYGILKSEEKEIIADVVQPQALRYLKNCTEPYSILFYPILRRGEVIGMIAGHRAISNPFKEKDVLLIKRAARFLDELEIFASREQKLEFLRLRWERIENGIHEMLKQNDPTDMAGETVRTLSEILPLKMGFIVIQSSLYDYASLITHGFPPPEMETLEPNSWSYYLFTHQEESLYLSKEVGLDTRMPILTVKEKFPENKIVYLQKLVSGNNILGVAGAIGTPSEPFTEENKSTAYHFLKEASALLELSLLNISLQQLAVKDGLTSLFNRRYFTDRFHQEFSRAERTTEPLSLLMVDIDHFKKINDSYGHPIGDIVLKEVASRIQSNVREMDIVSRYGGEEFCAILPSCKLNDAFDIGERIRTSVSSKPILSGNTPLEATVSVGVSSFPETAKSEKTLLSSADSSLYEAKKSGRNRVVTAKK